jgi:hypothetical protein
MSKKLELLNKQIQVKTKLAQVKAARELAALIPELIKLRTRQAGEGVDGELDGLEKSTEAYRQRYSENLHPDTTPSTSNLTATGQLLDAIQGKNTGSKVKIDIKGGKRKGELSGGKSKKTNKDVRKYVEDAGRKFLELSEAEKDEVIELARQIILDELRSVIK